MIYTQQFFVGAKYLGSNLIHRTPIRDHGYIIAPHAYAYFCADCGDIWARRVIVDERGTQEKFFSVNKGCEKHRIRGIPGSLQHELEESQLTIWPDEVIRYEFNQFLKYYKEEIDE